MIKVDIEVDSLEELKDIEMFLFSQKWDNPPSRCNIKCTYNVFDNKNIQEYKIVPVKYVQSGKVAYRIVTK